jgi:serine/threonine-protein kinase
VDLRTFDAKGVSVYEVEFSGRRGNFVQIVNDTVVKPLNKKLQTKAFSLLSARGDAVELAFRVEGDVEEVVGNFKSMPPASLSDAPAGRIERLIRDDNMMMEKVAKINPGAVEKLEKGGTGEQTSGGVSEVEEF